MGNLTKSVMMLTQEIGSLRQARVSLLKSLLAQTEARRESVSDMCAAFARDRANAQRVWQGLNTGPSAPVVRKATTAPPPVASMKAMPIAPPPPSPKKVVRAAAPKPAAPPVKVAPAVAPTPKHDKHAATSVAPTAHAPQHAAKHLPKKAAKRGK